jgi:CDP-diglyceride synthetase
MGIIGWAFDHSYTKDSKYSESHSIFAFTYSLVLFISSLYFATKLLPGHISIEYHPAIAIFLTIYLVIMISTRMLENGKVALYEVSWACNLCMIEVIYGLVIQDGRLLEAALITVCVDQILWYVDIAGYIVKRKFPIGVAKYLIWPETSNLRRLTSTHHLWFIPLIQYILGKQVLSYDSLTLALVNIIML